MVQERPSREERAFRREKAEAMLRCEREYLMARRALGL
jgi:hypothetical protein